MNHHIGIASTLTDGDVHRLHGAQRVFTRDQEGPKKWGRSVVVPIVLAGRERLHGVAMVWGPNAEAVLQQLAEELLPDPVLLLVCAQTVPDGHELALLVAQLTAAGRVVHLLVVPPTGMLLQLRIEGREVRGLPSPGQLRTSAPPVRPQAPLAPRRPAPPQVVRSVLPAAEEQVPETTTAAPPEPPKKKGGPKTA